MTSSFKTSISSHGIEYTDSDVQADDVYVFLHGISSGAGSWVRQFEMRGEQYRLIAWNAPGYGRSRQLAHDKPAASDYAQRLFQLCQDLQLKQVTLVGHSLGALMAAAFAAEHPDRVSRLVLCSVATGYASETEAFRQALFDRRVKGLAEAGYESLFERRGPALIREHKPENFEVVRQAMSRLNVRGFRQAVWLLANDSIYPYLDRFKVKPELIYGAEDGVTTPETMLQLQQKIEFSKVTAIRNAGHLVYLDQPELFNESVFI